MSADVPMMFIVEGISGSGKTTILKNIVKDRGFIDYGIHRATATQWVHGTLQKDRPVDIRELRHWEIRMANVQPTVLILCHCPVEFAQNRKKHDAFKDSNPEVLQQLFNIYFDHLTSFNYKIAVNTGIELEHSLGRVHEYIRKVEKERKEILDHTRIKKD